MPAEKKTHTPFVQAPTKIFSIGLDAYEIATFFALSSHGGKNGSGIFPSWTKLRKMLGGLSRDRLWKCLTTLRDCNVIQWDRGRTGVANNYLILGVGCWTQKKNVDKSRNRVDKSGGTSPPHGLPWSARKTTGSPPHGHQPYPVEPDPTNKGGALNSVVDNLVKKIRDREKEPSS